MPDSPLGGRNLGMRLKEYRARRGISLRVAARESGVHYSILSRLEIGKGYVGPNARIDIARYLGIGLERISEDRVSKLGKIGIEGDVDRLLMLHGGFSIERRQIIILLLKDWLKEKIR